MSTIYAHNAAGHVGLAAARVRGHRVNDGMYPCGWQAGNRVTSTSTMTSKSTGAFTTAISHKTDKAWRPKETST